MVDKLLDTQPFFENVQGLRKYGLKTLVEDFASDTIKEQFEHQQHSALIDARALADVCLGKNRQRFIQFVIGCYGDEI